MMYLAQVIQILKGPCEGFFCNQTKVVSPFLIHKLKSKTFPITNIIVRFSRRESTGEEVAGMENLKVQENALAY